MYANTFTPCKIVSSVYTVEPPLTATFHNGHLFVLADSLFTDSCLNHSAMGWAPLYNGNGQLKHVSDCQNNLLTMASFFSD